MIIIRIILTPIFKFISLILNIIVAILIRINNSKPILIKDSVEALYNSHFLNDYSTLETDKFLYRIYNKGEKKGMIEREVLQ